MVTGLEPLNPLGSNVPVAPDPSVTPLPLQVPPDGEPVNITSAASSQVGP